VARCPTLWEGTHGEVEDHGDRLSREVAKLDHDEERALAEEGMASELASWPES